MKDWFLFVMKVEFVKNAKRNIIFGVINRIVVMVSVTGDGRNRCTIYWR